MRRYIQTSHMPSKIAIAALLAAAAASLLYQPPPPSSTGKVYTTDLVVYSANGLPARIPLHLQIKMSDLEHRVQNAIDNVECLVHIGLQSAVHKLDRCTTWDRMAKALMSDVNDKLEEIEIAIMHFRDGWGRIDHLREVVRTDSEMIHSWLVELVGAKIDGHTCEDNSFLYFEFGVVLGFCLPFLLLAFRRMAFN